MLEHVDTVLSFAVVMLLLSLLITGLVQIVVAVFAQRRAILKLGIERLLRQVAPNLGDKASDIAEAVLTHPALSTGKSQPTAIEKEELIRLLDDLSTSATSSLSPELKQALAQVMGVAVLPEIKTLAQSVQTELTKAFTAEAEVAKIKLIVEHATESSRRIAADVTAWFDTVMDRTTDLFQQRTRWISIGFAVVLAFVFQIDSLKILHLLASDAELRAKLVQSADATLRKAEAFLPIAAGPTNPASLAIEEAFKNLANKPAFRMISTTPAGVVTDDQAIAWIQETVKDPNSQQEMMSAYEKQLQQIVGPEAGELLASVRQIKTTLEDSTLVAFPKSLPGISQYWSDGMHFWGVLMTAFFLSLGAPFWYNALKQLSNLRPAIAQKIDQVSQPPK